MVLPRLLTVPLIIQTLRLYLRYYGLVLYAVEVFMKAVQQKIEKLLRVLLLEVIEL